MHRSEDSSTGRSCTGKSLWGADLEERGVVSDSQSQLLVGTVQIIVLQEKGSLDVRKKPGEMKSRSGHEDQVQHAHAETRSDKPRHMVRCN